MTTETNPAAAHSGKYRPDIDGLRALAILPVMLYHARLGCRGGFVGVDVFFVISGFLITSLILDELDGGTFSLLHFWERRIRRIGPAMVVVLLAVFFAASYWFLPDDFAEAGKSIACQAVSGGNFYFWKQSGYFAPGAETQPLLHTWSLAVEEQFYLLFPLLLIGLASLGKNAVRLGIAVLALTSFAFSVFGTYSSHFTGLTFYLLPGRMWELMLGAWLAAHRGEIPATRAIREAAGWLGLALIAWPVFHYSSATRFPGMGALPPCLGAALVIFSSETKLSSVGSVLAFKPVVFIGLISYSLYLWHWPLLAFAAYLSKDEPEARVRLGLLLASVALAAASWQWIEKPFRQRRIFRARRSAFAFAGVSLATLLAAGLAVDYGNGFPARMPAAVMTYANARNHRTWVGDTDQGRTWAGHLARFSETQSNRPVDVLIWGDSHAMALAPVIDTLCQQRGWLDMEATRSGTPPVLGSYQVKGKRETPSVFSGIVFQYIAQNHPRTVVLSAKWSGYTVSDALKSNLVATVRGLLGLGVQVYVVKDVPWPGYDVPRFAAMAAMHHGDIQHLGLMPAEYDQTNQDLYPAFDQIGQLGATVLNPAPYFLNTNGLYGVEKNGNILYFDGDHLTVDGSMLLVPLFKPLINSQIAR